MHRWMRTERWRLTWIRFRWSSPRKMQIAKIWILRRLTKKHLLTRKSLDGHRVSSMITSVNMFMANMGPDRLLLFWCTITSRAAAATWFWPVPQAVAKQKSGVPSVRNSILSRLSTVRSWPVMAGKAAITSRIFFWKNCKMAEIPAIYWLSLMKQTSSLSRRWHQAAQISQKWSRTNFWRSWMAIRWL